MSPAIEAADAEVRAARTAVESLQGAAAAELVAVSLRAGLARRAGLSGYWRSRLGAAIASLDRAQRHLRAVEPAAVAVVRPARGLN